MPSHQGLGLQHENCGDTNTQTMAVGIELTQLPQPQVRLLSRVFCAVSQSLPTGKLQARFPSGHFDTATQAAGAVDFLYLNL